MLGVDDEEIESEELEKVYETQLSPTDAEKKSILSFALELRNEATFCDVAFLIKGNLFRAHRIIVGSWSRWLRALLSDGPEEEVVCLDMFTPEAFGDILDYMYGKPFLFSVENAESYLKVLRRLEMQHLEQQCWQFLTTVIDSSNCERLHELADIFDCPSLKLCAWRILQEAIPGYASAPNIDPNGVRPANALKGNGLTGPCDIDYDLIDEEDMDAAPDMFPEEEIDDDDMDESVDVFSEPAPIYPKQLPKDTKAADLVKAWSVYLHFVYKQCNAPPGTRNILKGPKENKRNSDVEEFD